METKVPNKIRGLVKFDFTARAVTEMSSPEYGKIHGKGYLIG